MSLFQNSVEQKYLNQLDYKLLDTKFNEFKAYFGNPEIQDNIRNSKEEQFQEGFLSQLFVKILGYTLNPSSNFNLTTEYKNIKDSKKADGAIVINTVVRAVIELKGTNTTDLSKIEVQAFGYKNNQPDCVYVITSNFEKLRFYIDNAIEFIEFNLFTLTKRDFDILYLCLSFDSIAKGIPKTIKTESVSQEDIITKKLYQDYSLFKSELHQDLVSQNPQFDALTLFKKSQKLLDRFLFLFFAEDRQLLPPNSVRLIVNDWKELQERDVQIPLYDRFKKYFEYLNTGYKGKRYDVFAYNGGLFKPDAILDTIKIDDGLLFKHTITLADYDFASEVDVNILGHIFENSLNELDAVKAQIEGQEVDKSKTRRKKDGVFYTPKYITKYIVENTIGKLCAEKKIEIDINEADYITDKKRQLKTKQILLDKLNSYSNWLLQLTICDPACGSGAFLNQALDFLISEHRYIDELKAKLYGVPMILSDIEKSILENNLFGVDLNEESVEIAKLSLWLRTAQPNRKLNDLNNNIKCGNSLIDDTSITGEKAFNWQKEFPEIFVKGGFDIVIGNPPYGDYFSIVEKPYLLTKYSNSFSGTFDMYIFFFDISLRILKERGLLCFITPNTFIDYAQFSNLRIILSNGNNIEQIIGLTNVFEDAIVDNAIILLTKSKYQEPTFLGKSFKEKINSLEINCLQNLDSKNLSSEGFILKSSEYFNVYKLIEKQPYKLGDLFKITQGITTGGNESFLNNKSHFLSNEIPEAFLKKVIKGKTINRYRINYDNEYILYSIKTIDIDIQNKIALLLEPFRNELSQKRETKQGKLPWYCLHWARDEKDFNEPKILIRQTASHIIGVLDINGYYPIDTIHTLNLKIEQKDKEKVLNFLLGLLNSKLFRYLYCWKLDEEGKVYPQVKKVNIEWLPIPEYTDSDTIHDEVDKLQKTFEEEDKLRIKFLKYLDSKYNLISKYNGIQNWHELEFGKFLIEFNKAIKISGGMNLAKKDEIEWMELFEDYKQQIQSIKIKIETAERAIDQMVYKLYELTEEEIRIVEQ